VRQAAAKMLSYRLKVISAVTAIVTFFSYTKIVKMLLPEVFWCQNFTEMHLHPTAGAYNAPHVPESAREGIQSPQVT